MDIEAGGAAISNFIFAMFLYNHLRRFYEHRKRVGSDIETEVLITKPTETTPLLHRVASEKAQYGGIRHDGAARRDQKGNSFQVRSLAQWFDIVSSWMLGLVVLGFLMLDMRQLSHEGKSSFQGAILVIFVTLLHMLTRVCNWWKRRKAYCT